MVDASDYAAWAEQAGTSDGGSSSDDSDDSGGTTTRREEFGGVGSVSDDDNGGGGSTPDRSDDPNPFTPRDEGDVSEPDINRSPPDDDGDDDPGGSTPDRSGDPNPFTPRDEGDVTEPDINRSPPDDEGSDPADNIADSRLTEDDIAPPGQGIEETGEDEPGATRFRYEDEGGTYWLTERDLGGEIERGFLEENPQFTEDDVRVTRDGETIQVGLTAQGQAQLDIEAIDAVERQLEAQTGRDVEPGRDFVVRRDGAGGYEVETTETFAADRRQSAVASRREQLEDPGSGPSRQAFARAEQAKQRVADVLVSRDELLADPGTGLSRQAFARAEEATRELEAVLADREAGDSRGVAVDETVFRFPAANIEAVVGDLSQGRQAADFRPTADYERQDIGDEAFQATIPGPFQLGGRGGGRATVSLPGAGQDVEEFLGQEAREFGTFAEQVGAGVENLIPVPGLSGALGETATGFTRIFNVPGLAAAGIETYETSAFLAGGLEGDDIGRRTRSVAGQVGPQAVQAAEFTQERPFETIGLVAGGVATGAAAGSAITRAPSAVRAARIRSRGGDIYRFEDLSKPPETTMGELPAFTERASRDPDIARREFEQQTQQGALSDALDEPTAFSGRAGEDVAEYGGFGRQFEAPEGSAEIPGLFFAADLSPLRLPGATRSSLSVPRPGLPRPRIRQARVAAEIDPDVRRMPSDVLTYEDAARFMAEDADAGGLFVRSERLITAEQEAIAPPGAGFVGERVFGIRVGGVDLPLTDRRVGGEIVTGRVYRRTGVGDVDIEDVLDESSQGLESIRRLEADDATQPFAPTGAPVSPADVETTAPAATDPTQGPVVVSGDDTAFLTDVVSPVSATSPVSTTGFRTPTSPSATVASSTVPTGSPGGSPTEVPSSTPTGPPSGPPSSPPSSPPSDPPSGPPTGPPTGPPSAPPSGPPSAPPTQPPIGPPFVPPTSPPNSPPADWPDPSQDVEELDIEAEFVGGRRRYYFDFLNPVTGELLETDPEPEGTSPDAGEFIGPAYALDGGQPVIETGGPLF